MDSEKKILARDTSILKVIELRSTNCGNVVVEVISSSYVDQEGKTDYKGYRMLTTIDNPVVGGQYEQKSVMVPMGSGQNWEIVSTKLL